MIGRPTTLRRFLLATVFNSRGTIGVALDADLAVKEELARSAIEAARRDATIRADQHPARDDINPAL